MNTIPVRIRKVKNQMEMSLKTVKFWGKQVTRYILNPECGDDHFDRVKFLLLAHERCRRCFQEYADDGTSAPTELTFKTEDNQSFQRSAAYAALHERAPTEIYPSLSHISHASGRGVSCCITFPLSLNVSVEIKENVTARYVIVSAAR